MPLHTNTRAGTVADLPAEASVFRLAGGALHEFYAEGQADGVAMLGLVLSLARAERPASTLWVRHAALDQELGAPGASGLAEWGAAPSGLILVRLRDGQAALQAGLEGARCASLGAVVIELWGASKAYDLVASRRLALAAQASGLPVMLARVSAGPVASAAETRWSVRAAPSRALAAGAPGNPAFELVLLRARNGREGVRHSVEWDRDGRNLVIRSSSAAVGDSGHGSGFESGHEVGDGRITPLSGAALSVSVDRPDAPPGAARRMAG
jgi:protein ImuA